MEKYKCKSVGIIGSGIQGACIGLQLIKKDIPVTIFDRHDPLSSDFQPASYGNAGHFSPYSALQFNRTDILYDVPKMLFSSYGPLALKWNYVTKMIPWFLHYLKNCNKKSMLHTAKYMTLYVEQVPGAVLTVTLFIQNDKLSDISSQPPQFLLLQGSVWPNLFPIARYFTFTSLFRMLAPVFLTY
mgnify:CR=1 FL=1